MVYEQRNFDINKWPKDWRKFFSDDAFKGAGQQLRIAAEPGTQVSQYSISWTEPYLKDKPISMTVAGSQWERARESYVEERQKAYLGFTHRLKDGWYRILAFRLENVTVKDVDKNAPSQVKDVEGKNLLAGIKIGFGRDTTDNRFMPTKGKSFEFSYEQVGGDNMFGIAEGTLRWYKTLREDIARRKTVLETKVYLASIVGDAPVFEKFYAGGIGSVRGFAYRGISPRAGKDDDPIGSKWIATASGEVSVPLTAEALSALFFVDTGMVETGGVRASAGIGIQIMIPQWFGPVPMRFELADPLLKSKGDKTQIFSFSAGALF
jgi:outer membrane protein insertion porin family